MTALSAMNLDVVDVAAVADRRAELLAAVAEHAGRMARDIARIDGGDHGRRSFSTERGTWTIKHEAGDIEFLRHEPRGGGEIYVVSMRSAAEPEELSRALGDYGAFVAAYNDRVAELAGLLDNVDADFPPVDSTGALVVERDRLVERITSCCERMASELRRQEGSEYGTFAARVDGTRWELKRDGGHVSYLRVGGSSGIYLLSQYGPPSAVDVREHAPRFGEFVDAYNDHVAALERDIDRIEL
jgi:hypothetical protein